MEKNKLEIVDEIDGTTLAYRTKSSIELYTTTKEVGFSDFSYSWEDIIAVGRKLEELRRKNLADVL